MQNSILFKLLPGMFEVQTNFWNSTFPVSNCSYSYDQRNAVVCNSVIEKLEKYLRYFVTASQKN